MTTAPATDSLLHFHPAVQAWFRGSFPDVTPAQAKSWPAIANGENTLLLAPTGSGKTLAAFLIAINRILFPNKRIEDPADAIKRLAEKANDKEQTSQKARAKEIVKGVRTLYISPLKALGVDVERNLRAPLAGVSAVAQRDGFAFHAPTVGVRSGDTPPTERRAMTRRPPDILITTPESLYLLLTSQAREILRTVDTVIIDEIHTMVSTKRGTHLFLSLERLEEIRNSDRPLQRIGLSATQRPLEEVARLLGGYTFESADAETPSQRPVTIVEAGRRKPLELTVEVPVEDMAKMAENPSNKGQQGQGNGPGNSPEPSLTPQIQTGPAAGAGPGIASIWTAMHPRLVELIREHKSTMIFVNSRRLAERLSKAINEVAEEDLAAAHHGSIAKDQRALVEDRLKRGLLPAIVATSSLELGIDMGAVDLVIQIESPPTIASGIQRIGRAGHQVGVPSQGVIFPKYRGDLLACSAAVGRMIEGKVESTLYPRNPLDILAQQLVAMVALEPKHIDELYRTVRRAAPFADLSQGLFENVLDLLSGRYPSSEFAELRPRVNWDRITGIIQPRKSAQRMAVINGGTIPDRGLYGVFLMGDENAPSSRVGELDEEMVFETQVGDVFLLGASSWRVQEITHDRVLVIPAPGEPGRMPFWRGDSPGRPLEFGQAIGQLARELVRMDRKEAQSRLANDHALDRRAAFNLMEYLHEQQEVTGEVPSDRTIVIESFLDEVGDWRVAVLTPFGARVHAPWATAIGARLEQECHGEADMMWTDDGMVFRLPGSDSPPETELFFPPADEIRDLVVRTLGGTAMFAAKFRENAARALLLPRRQPGRRTPLWLQRRKSADLLSVAAQYDQFPIILETFRECLRDVFDLDGLKNILSDVASRKIRLKSVQTSSPSPFAASLMYGFTANFLYNGDAPLAERKAATLSLDLKQLRDLLGDAEMRQLLDGDVLEQLSLELQRLDGKRGWRDADQLHDMLRLLGDLDADEVANRQWRDEAEEGAVDAGNANAILQSLIEEHRVLPVQIANQSRFIAIEDAGCYRDALGIVPPVGVPIAFLEPVMDPLRELVGRFARTHGPFHVEEPAARWGLGVAPIRQTLEKLLSDDRVVEGEFVPGGNGREWCNTDVLRKLKQRSLARVRQQVEPVEAQDWTRFLCRWQGIEAPRRGLDAVLDTIEQLQGAPLPASEWEQSVLARRVVDYEPGQLDELCAAGEIVWRGIEPIGAHDGRITFYLADTAAHLAPLCIEVEEELDRRVLELLEQQGALFFDRIVSQTKGFAPDVLSALWRLVWSGHITNDSLAPVRSLLRSSQSKSKRGQRGGRGGRSGRSGFRSRRTSQLPGSEGRWTATSDAFGAACSPTERSTAIATQLLQRYGIVTRETVAREGLMGGFSRLYPIYRAMEEAGRARRGYFVAGQGAAQFALPGADDRLRVHDNDSKPRAHVLAAVDPANPFGATLPWPSKVAGAKSADRDAEAATNKSSGKDATSSRPQRTAGARVVIVDGQLLGYLSRSGKRLLTFLPEDAAGRDKAMLQLGEALADWCDAGQPIYLHEIDGERAGGSRWAQTLRDHGFVPFGDQLQRRSAGTRK